MENVNKVHTNDKKYDKNILTPDRHSSDSTAGQKVEKLKQIPRKEKHEI